MKIVFIYFLVNFIIRWLLGVIIKKTLKLIGNALYYFNEVCDKYIKFIMKNKYIKIEELQRSMVIKVKYIIRYFRDIIIRTSYKYTLNIRDLIRISMFNIMCLLFTCKYFEIDVDLTFFYEIIEKYILLNGNIRGHIILIILIPFVYIICSYINIRSEFSKISEELYKKLELLLSSINHNIKELSKYGIDERLKHIAKEMTDNIGFKFIDNKLEENSMYLYSDEEDDYSRFPYNYKEDRKNNGLQLISKHVEEINELVQLSTKRNNLFTCNMYFISLQREKEVVNFMLDKNYIHNSEYFKKYHNQIYKKIYTNARVVKKECLNLLEKHKKLSEIWLKEYEENLRKYEIDLLVIELQSYNYYKRIYEIVYTRNIFDIIRIIIIQSFKLYLEIILKILY